MLEDALKVARNSQRLLLMVSVVAAVFLLSLRDVTREERLLHFVEAIPIVVTEAYPRWVSQTRLPQVNTARYELASRLKAALKAELGAVGLGGLDVTPVTAALPHPVQLVHITFKDSPLSIGERNIGNGLITWHELERSLRSQSITTNAQVVFVDLEKAFPQLLKEVPDFLSKQYESPAVVEEVDERRVSGVVENRVNRRPESIRFSHVEIVQGTFSPAAQRERVSLTLTFLFHQPGDSPGFATKFTTSLPGTTEEISASSWWTWYINASGLAPLTPDLNSADAQPPLDASLSVRELRDELKRRIDAGRAANRTIDFVGLSLPGPLALVGIPLSLTFLIYSLWVHTVHLYGYARQHQIQMGEFAWTPLARGDLWLWESLSIILVVPVAVHLLLIYRASAFTVRHEVAMTAGFIGAIVAALGGVAVMRSLVVLRACIQTRGAEEKVSFARGTLARAWDQRRDSRRTRKRRRRPFRRL